jgi:hypothetical protein
MEGKFLLKKPAGCGRHLFLWKENSSLKNLLAVAEAVSMGGKFLHRKYPG